MLKWGINRPLIIGLIVLGVSIFSSLIFNQDKTFALSGNQFQAGRIIDDSVFFNSGDMDANTIQLFLNSKVPVCDTWHTSTNPSYQPPFTCLKDYVQTTVAKSPEPGLCQGYGVANQSAAQIIYGVAQSCGVNPKVLIVLLQKEQSLITDDWPWSIQYRSATGYGCPDTAPCDSQYYGFFNQVYAAARQYKNYAKNPSYYNYKANQNNYILYNPNSACGGTQVFIQNQATAGLYNYTPYQPNAAALNNLYGTGDGCSAYGNRNFWRMYNDWFGLTIGSLVKTANSDTVYLLNGNKAHAIYDNNVLNDYANLGPVRTTAASEINQYTGSSAVGRIAGDKDGNLYLVNSSIKLKFDSCNLVVDYGFECNPNKILYLSDEVLARLYAGPKVTSTLRSNTSFTTYYLDNGKKRRIPSIGDLNDFNQSWTNVLSASLLESYPEGLPAYGPGSLVKTINSSNVYIVKDIDSIMPLSSFTFSQELGLGKNVRTVASAYSLTAPIRNKLNCGGLNYLATKGVLYSVSSDMLTKFGYSAGDFIDAGLICDNVDKSSTPLGQYIRVNNGTIYLVDNGQKRAFKDYQVFQSPTYCNNACKYVNVSDYLASTISTGLPI